jgi:hypothetical protein
VRFHYEFTGDSGVAYSMIYAVTDPRLTGPFHDERLERTWVHDTTGLQLLASETPARLTLPLDQWLPARYLASYSWPIPAEHVQHRADGVTYYYRSRGVDVPFIATESADHAWVVASIARESGNVWSNPELTCQHVDPQTSLAPGGRAVEEMEMIVFHGKLAFAFAHAIAIRPSLQ